MKNKMILKLLILLIVIISCQRTKTACVKTYIEDGAEVSHDVEVFDFVMSNSEMKEWEKGNTADYNDYSVKAKCKRQ